MKTVQRKKQHGGVTGKGFLPGQSGNPAGRPPEEWRRELRLWLESPEVQAQVRQRALKSDYLMGKLLEHAYGRPTQPVEFPAGPIRVVLEYINNWRNP